MRDSLNRELEREFIFNHVLSVGENKPFKLNNISPLSEGE